MHIQPVFSGGLQRLAQQGEVARDEGVVAPLDLEEVRVAHQAENEVRNAAGYKAVGAYEVDDQQHDGDWQRVERDEQWVLQHEAEAVPERTGRDEHAHEQREAHDGDKLRPNGPVMQFYKLFMELCHIFSL